MPITFIDIERRKSWRIVIFFIVLVVLYFVISLSIAASFYQLFSLGLIPVRLSLPGSVIAVISVASIIIASIHFFLSALDAVTHIKKGLGALQPDAEDEVHKQFMNIVDEIRIAAGGKINIQCLVLPTVSMNALSAVDLRGNAIIAITEGLLSQLSRSQLEAVVAHEAYHILSGDCMETTVAASLFGIPSAAIEKISAASGGRMLFAPAFLLAWLMVKLSFLLSMFISREREYRADAGAVRMTRDPLSLAGALYLLSRQGQNPVRLGPGVEMLCIMNASGSRLEESEGRFAGLSSTHPPVNKRIKVLLRMAHAGISSLTEQVRDAPGIKVPEKGQSLFYALDAGYQWQGPFTLPELAVLPWLSSDSWISGGGTVAKVSQMPLADVIFREHFAEDRQAVSGYPCPSCGHSLIEKTYEKTKIYRCKFCGGALVDDVKLPRIIVRTDIKFSERINTLSEMTLRENQAGMLAGQKNRSVKGDAKHLYCPKCKSNMNRTFYSLAYLVEIDHCSCCKISWFENDELEMLQCMIERKMASKPLTVFPRSEAY